MVYCEAAVDHNNIHDNIQWFDKDSRALVCPSWDKFHCVDISRYHHKAPPRCPHHHCCCCGAHCYMLSNKGVVESGWSEWCESVTALHGSINYGGSSALSTLQHWTRGLLTLTSVGTCVGTWYWYRVHTRYTLYTLYTSLVPSPPKTTPHCPHSAPWPPQQRRYTDIPELSNHLQSLHTLHFTTAV